MSDNNTPMMNNERESGGTEISGTLPTGHAQNFAREHFPLEIFGHDALLEGTKSGHLRENFEDTSSTRIEPDTSVNERARQMLADCWDPDDAEHVTEIEQQQEDVPLILINTMENQTKTSDTTSPVTDFVGDSILSVSTNTHTTVEPNILPTNTSDDAKIDYEINGLRVPDNNEMPVLIPPDVTNTEMDMDGEEELQDSPYDVGEVHIILTEMENMSKVTCIEDDLPLSIDMGEFRMYYVSDRLGGPLTEFYEGMRVKQEEREAKKQWNNRVEVKPNVGEEQKETIVDNSYPNTHIHTNVNMGNDDTNVLRTETTSQPSGDNISQTHVDNIISVISPVDNVDSIVHVEDNVVDLTGDDISETSSSSSSANSAKSEIPKVKPTRRRNRKDAQLKSERVLRSTTKEQTKASESEARAINTAQNKKRIVKKKEERAEEKENDAEMEDVPQKGISKRPLNSKKNPQHKGIILTRQEQMGEKGAKDVVTYTRYKIDGHCDECSIIKQTWEMVCEGHTNKTTYINSFLAWARRMYEEQIKDMGSAFPKLPEVKMGKLIKIQWTDAFAITNALQTAAWQSEYEQWVQSEEEQATVWVCHDQAFNLAVIRALKSTKHAPQLKVVLSNSSHTLLDLVRCMIQAVSAHNVPVTEEMPREWLQSGQSLLYLMGVMEELVRTSSFDTEFDMRGIIAHRMEYALTTICEHEQRRWRNGENQYATGRETVEKGEVDTDYVIHTLSNVFGIGQNYHNDKLTIIPHDAPTVLEEIIPGELSSDNQQLWVGSEVVGANLIYMTNPSDAISIMSDVWNVYKKRKAYNEKHGSRSARRKRAPSIGHAPEDAVPILDEELLQQLNDATKHWKHDWTKPQSNPYKYEEEEFDELFQETGFIIMQFAQGSELEQMRKDTIERATKSWKMAIINDLEVITTTRKKGKVHKEWETIARDVARFQTPMEDSEEMPGTEVINKYYPPTPTRNDGVKPVMIMYKNLIYSHKGCMAQNVHWDMDPSAEEQVNKLLGSVLVALWETRLIIYPMSHQWNRCDNKLRKPIVIVMPAGSILFFSTLVHAGYGVWSLDEAVFRPTSSFDDMTRINIRDLLIRYQAHIARPMNNRKQHKSINPTRTIRMGMYEKLASYIHMDRREALKVYYPPVFVPEEGDIGLKLEYGNPSIEVQLPQPIMGIDLHQHVEDAKGEDDILQKADAILRKRKKQEDLKAAKRLKAQFDDIRKNTSEWRTQMNNQGELMVLDENCWKRFEPQVEEKEQDIVSLLDSHQYLGDWFMWMAAVYPPMQDWRNRLENAFRMVVSRGELISKFEENLISRIPWLATETRVPSLHAWSIVLGVREFVDVEFEKLLIFQCREGEKLNMIWMVTFGTEKYKFFVKRTHEMVEIVVSTVNSELLQSWVKSKLENKTDNRFSGFSAYVIAAWFEQQY